MKLRRPTRDESLAFVKSYMPAFVVAVLALGVAVLLGWREFKVNPPREDPSGWRRREGGAAAVPREKLTRDDLPLPQEPCKESPYKDCVLARKLDFARPENKDFKARRVVFKEKVNLNGAKLEAFEVFESRFEKGISAERAAVSGSFVISDDMVDGRSKINEERCPGEEFIVNPSGYRSVVLGDADLRNLVATEISLSGTKLDSVNLSGAEAKKELRVQWTYVDRNLTAQSAHVGLLQAFRLHVGGELNVSAASVELGSAAFECASLNEINFNWLSAKHEVSLGLSKIDGLLQLYNLQASRLEFAGASLNDVKMGGTVLDAISFTRTKLRKLELGQTTIGTAYMTEMVGMLDAGEATLQRFSYSVSKGENPVDGMLSVLGQADGSGAPNLHASFETALRAAGRLREANRVRLVSRWRNAQGLERVGLILLDGIGPPHFYLSLLVFLTAIGVLVWFGRWTPEGEAREKYNPWITSLATLLPGDLLGYLRLVKFEPKDSTHAAWLTVLQLTGLLVQTLLLLSVVSLVR
jgi:uncharacterized protein YjbI with pentapeptide repeats